MYVKILCTPTNKYRKYAVCNIDTVVLTFKYLLDVKISEFR